MTKNKFIHLVTSNNIFAFFYILTFIFVIVMAFTNGGAFWVKLAWLMLALLGVFISITAFVSHAEARRSIRWPTVPARLINAGVRKSIGSDETYAPEVEYEFKFNGEKYRGNTIDYSASSRSETAAQKVIQKIKNKGVALTVHVNPQDPQRNVLNPGVQLVHYLRYLIGPAMFVFGMLALFDMIDFSKWK
jgi:hypothetical protein